MVHSTVDYIDGLVQERRNSSALVMALTQRYVGQRKVIA